MTGTLTNGSSPGLALAGAGDDVPRILVIDLDPPIEWNGKTYETMRIEEPTGRMVLKAESELQGGANFLTLRNYQFSLVSNASGIPRQAIEMMRISDITKASDFLASFMPGGLRTGGI